MEGVAPEAQASSRGGGRGARARVRRGRRHHPGGRGPRPRLLGPGGLGAFVESRERTLARIAVARDSGGTRAGPPGPIHRVGPRRESDARGSAEDRAATLGGDASAGPRGRPRRRRETTASPRFCPRGAKAEHVYEVSMEESDFVSGLEVMDLLANPNVVGVFRTPRPAPRGCGAEDRVRRHAPTRRGRGRGRRDAVRPRRARDANCGGVWIPSARARRRQGGATAATCTVCCDTCHCTTRGPRIRVCTRCTLRPRTPPCSSSSRPGWAPAEGETRAPPREKLTATAVDRFARIVAGAPRRVRVSPERRERRGGRHRGPIGALREGSRLDRGVRQERRGRGRRARVV